MITLPDCIGIMGVIIQLIAYLALSTERLSALTLRYQLFNCIGAIGVLFSLFFFWNLSSALIESAWIIISIIGMIRIIKYRKT